MGCIRRRSDFGKSRPWRDCRTCSATGASNCSSRPTQKRASYTSRSVNSKWSWTFSKKGLNSSVDQRRQGIDPEHSLTIARQCELLGLARSTYYHVPQPESAEDLQLMRKIDELYLQRPFFGSRKMAVELGINRKRAQR